LAQNGLKRGGGGFNLLSNNLNELLLNLLLGDVKINRKSSFMVLVVVAVAFDFAMVFSMG